MTTAEERVEALRSQILSMAAGQAHGNAFLRDECAQEGMIAAWRAAVGLAGASDAYLVASARNRMVDVHRGRPLLGGTSCRGKRDAFPMVAAQLTTSSDDDSFTEVVDEGLDPFEMVMQRRLISLVRQAQARLSPGDRHIVHLRFTEEKTWAQIAESVGVGPEAVRRYFHNHIAPALRDWLADTVSPDIE